MKRAFITGIAGQDGSYLSELLLQKGYEVHGTVRRPARLGHHNDGPEKANRRLSIHHADITDKSTIYRLLAQTQPDEIYNLAAQSHVKVSFEKPVETFDVTGTSVVRMLAAIRELGLKAKFYQASSSEMYGKVLETPQTERTPFYPRSPYAIAKAAGFWATVNSRESYGTFACNGILFNHESPRRGEAFVTRKITRAIARIIAGKQKEILLGNLDAQRDWGHARDYVEAMWMMLQASEPDDYVVATGATRKVRDFLDVAFGLVGLDWNSYVKVDERYFRPNEVDFLLGDASKVKRKLGWEPKTSFAELVREMVESDLRLEGVEPSSVIRNTARVVPILSRSAAKTPRIFIAGHRGLVGSALTEELKATGFTNLILRSHKELDLTNQKAVAELFRTERPDRVYLTAGKVGGIIANQTQPADFLYENAMIAANVIKAAADFGTEKLLFLGSSCIYPRLAEQPIKESSLLTSSLEKSNEGYAIAKIAGVKLCEYFRRQYGKNFISAMPCNLYGPRDNFHPQHSHVIPGLMRRFHEAKLQDLDQVVVWGTGKAVREFMHVRDLARALPFLMERYAEEETINLGSGAEVTIHELATTMGSVVGFLGKIVFDTTKPDGTPRKLLDQTKIKKLGWSPEITLRAGLEESYRWALENGVFEHPTKKSA